MRMQLWVNKSGFCSHHCMKQSVWLSFSWRIRQNLAENGILILPPSRPRQIQRRNKKWRVCQSTLRARIQDTCSLVGCGPLWALYPGQKRSLTWLSMLLWWPWTSVWPSHRPNLMTVEFPASWPTHLLSLILPSSGLVIFSPRYCAKSQNSFSFLFFFFFLFFLLSFLSSLISSFFPFLFPSFLSLTFPPPSFPSFLLPSLSPFSVPFFLHVLVIESRASCLLGKCFTTKSHALSIFWFCNAPVHQAIMQWKQHT